MEYIVTKIWTYCFILGFLDLLVCVMSQNLDKNLTDFQMTIRMPDAVSNQPDSLLCHAEKLNEQETYIMKYEPHASKNTAHHMMVYGCGHPGSDKPYWSCGEMNDRSEESVCSDGERQIIYAWALDGKPLALPEDVGFRVGGSTGINYVVIQLHYKDKFEDGKTDHSGVTLHMTNAKKTKQAGYYVLGNMGYIPPFVTDFHMESACEYRNNYKIYPIAYRTHSHNLGKVTSGYHIRADKWTELGRMSPQLPQTFYNISNPDVEIQWGDIVASRCTMTSQRDFPTRIGPTNRDEMCNFYILYYTYNTENLHVQYCFRDAQEFSWSSHFNNTPASASSIEGLSNFSMSDPYSVPIPRKPTKYLVNLM